MVLPAEADAAEAPSAAETTLDRRQVRRAFARAAAAYESHDGLQRETGQHLRAGLGRLVGVHRVLDIGAGTGLGAAELASQFPNARLIALDLALPMLHSTALRIAPRGACICADARSLPLTARSIDLLHSSLCIQWVRDAVPLFREFRRVLCAGGFLRISSLGSETLRELRQAWHQADPAQPHVGEFLRPQDLALALERAGFEEIELETEILVRRYPSVMALMHELKGIGATNAEAGRAPGLMGRRKFAQMEAAYESLRVEGSIPASWELIYLTARRPAKASPPRL